MKKKKDSLSAWMPPVRLYREDVDVLVERVAHTSEKGDVTLASGGYTFVSLDELRERRGNRVSHLEISSSGLASLSITIGGVRNGVGVFSFSVEDDSAAGHEWRYVRDFLREHVPWYGAILSAGVWLFVCLLTLIVLQFLYKTFAAIPTKAVIISACPVFLLLLSWLYRIRGSTIYLDPKHKVPSFWKRNADQIGVGAVGALIGSVLTLLVQAILRGLR